MEKTLTIDNKQVRFVANAAITYIYKNQFHKDLLLTMLPLVSDSLKALDEIYKKIAINEKKNIELERRVKVEEITVEQAEMMKEGGFIPFGILPSDIGNLIENIYTLELIDIQNIIWTMAKAADGAIPEPILWYGQFSDFELYDVAIQLIPMLMQSVISKKKLEQMKQKWKQMAK